MRLGGKPVSKPAGVRIPRVRKRNPEAESDSSSLLLYSQPVLVSNQMGVAAGAQVVDRCGGVQIRKRKMVQWHFLGDGAGLSACVRHCCAHQRDIRRIVRSIEAILVGRQQHFRLAASLCMARATNCEGSSHLHSFRPNSMPHRTLITCIWPYLPPSLSHKRTTQPRSPFATWTPTTIHLHTQSPQLT